MAPVCQSQETILITEIIHDQKRFNQLKPDWIDLSARCLDASFFSSWEWCSVWWQIYGTERQLCLITIREEQGRLLGLAPLYIEKRKKPFPIKKICLIGDNEVAGDSLGFLIDDERHISVLNRILKSVQKIQWDVLDFKDVPFEGRFFNNMQKWVSIQNFDWRNFRNEACPVITLPVNYDIWLASLGSRTRRNIRNFERRLAREYGARFEIDKVNVQNYNEMIQLHRLRQQKKSQFSPFLNSRMQAFHRQLLKESGNMLIGKMAMKKGALASVYLFQDKEKFYLYQGGYNPAAIPRSLNITLVLVAKCIEFAIQQEAKTFELLRGENNFKRSLTRQARQNVSFYISRTTAGNMFVLQKILGQKIKNTIKKIIPFWVWEYLKHKILTN